MAEDGIDDFALAKRKAARQLGAPTTEALPANHVLRAADIALREGDLGSLPADVVTDADAMLGYRAVSGLAAGAPLRSALLRLPLAVQQQGVQVRIGRVGGQGLREILEIAVQVHVLVRHAAHEGKAMGVERMDVEHGHAGRPRVLAPLGIVGGKHLHAGAAVALDPVAGRC